MGKPSSSLSAKIVFISCTSTFLSFSEKPLIRRDATRGYKMIVDEDSGLIRFPLYGHDIPITDDDRYNRKRMDPRMFANETVTLKPLSEK